MATTALHVPSLPTPASDAPLERHAVRENPILCALQTSEADAEFADSVHQLILFEI
jgi:hypothetical protein